MLPRFQLLLLPPCTFTLPPPNHPLPIANSDQKAGAKEKRMYNHIDTIIPLSSTLSKWGSGCLGVVDYYNHRECWYGDEVKGKYKDSR